MRIVMTFGILLICMASSLGNEKEEVAKQLYIATNTSKIAEQTIRSTLPIIQQSLGSGFESASEEEKLEMETLMNGIFLLGMDTFPFEAMEKLYVEIHVEVYTLEELRDILAFFETPSGKAYAGKQLEAMQLTGTKIQPIIADWYPKFEKEVEAFLEKNGKKAE